MHYLLTPYAVAQFLTGIIAVSVMMHLWQKRKSRGGWPLFLLFLAISEWALANGFEAAAVLQTQKIFWSKIAYIGAQTSPVFLLLFALQYTGRGRRVTPHITSLLFMMPLLVIFLAFTNDLHGLLWPGFLPGPAGSNSLIYLHGPVFWVAMVYVYSVIFAGTALLITYAVRSHSIYKKQNAIILLASLFPWISSLVYILDLNPFPGLDTISISFLFNGLLICGEYPKGIYWILCPLLVNSCWKIYPILF